MENRPNFIKIFFGGFSDIHLLILNITLKLRDTVLQRALLNALLCASKFIFVF